MSQQESMQSKTLGIMLNVKIILRMFKWPWYLPHPDIFSFWMANVALQLFKTPAKHSGLQNQQGSNVSKDYPPCMW